MAFFQSDLKETLRRLSSQGFASVAERDELLSRLSAAEGLRARDVAWMMFRPDRVFRENASALLQKLRDPETLDAFLLASKGAPEVAVRAATTALLALGLPGLDRRLGQLLVLPEKPTADARAMHDAARKLLADMQPSKATEPLLWQLESTAGDDAERLRVLERLALLDIDAASFARWQRLARHDHEAIRDAAIQVLATRAPEQSAAILAEQLPHAGYNAQQSIADALGKAAEKRGAEVTELVLPFLASGSTATRTAVMKILLRVPQRAAVVRRYIQFSKTLAGFVRDRSLESLREFGRELVEPIIELLRDPDDEVRAAAIGVAGSFDDPRLVEPVIPLLQDRDWWVRMAAAEMLGALKDPRAVEPLVATLTDPDMKWTVVEALGRIADPRALNPLGRMLGDPQPDVRIEVMRALRNFRHPQVLQALTNVASNDPNRHVRGRALEIIEELSARDKVATDMAALRNTALAARAMQGDPQLNALLIATRNQNASDFHLAIGQPPTVRLAADLLRAQGEPFTSEQTEAMIREILTEGQWEVLQRERQIDFCHFVPQAGRYRANVFLDHRGYSGVFRVIPERPPTIAELGLPAHLAEIADFHQGLVLICGPSGSGKSTTLAALVNLFNESRSDHVITLEDPIEFVHPFKNCLINQREVGTHTGSYARALRAALREDPDVIVIGELRDNESVSLALTAAETGHIVLGTLNSTSAAKAIDRVISSFPTDEQPQIRASISESLKYVIAQRLVPAKEAHRQVACFEVLKGTTTIAALIRDEKTYQIQSAMQIGRSQGMQTFDDALRDNMQRGRITPETAYLAALKKEDFEPLVSKEFLERGEA